MINIVHALSPFKTCPFNCPFCCAKENITNQNISLSDDYWKNFEKSIMNNYTNIMLTGDTEPTLFPDWLKKANDIAHQHNIITELRTHNYKYLSEDIHFNQVWYSITDAREVQNLPELYKHGMQFADEVNFAFLINKDFEPVEIAAIRLKLLDSKFTVRYLLDTCGSEEVANWVRTNQVTYSNDTERFLSRYNIRVKKNYSTMYDILRQDGHIYHEWQ